MSTEETKAIAMEVVSMLKAEGLVVVPASMLDAELQRKKAIARMLRKRTLTPYEIAKFELIPGIKSADTIKNMTKDLRIAKNEFYTDGRKMQIMTSAVKRLRGDE